MSKENIEAGLDKIFNEAIEKIDKALNSQETIWDYEPSEVEVSKICEKENLTKESIITASCSGTCRLFCLSELFHLRKKTKEMKRIEEEYHILFSMIL